MGFVAYQHTAANTILTLDVAIESFATPTQILSNYGTQFTSNKEPKDTRNRHCLKKNYTNVKSLIYLQE